MGRPTLLAIGLLLGAGSLLELRWAWRGLPVPKLELVSPQRVQKAIADARSSMPGPARAGVLLAIISRHFTTALHEPDALPRLIEDARAGNAQLTTTQVGRLQLVALNMLGLEREGVPIAEWWPKLQPYLAGLESASFAHFLPELLAANTEIWTGLGLGPGSARRSARNIVGFPHGPFLQYFVARMEKLAQAREEAGDAGGADACRRMVRRLLRQWVLDPGPPALRLLAADLLAESLLDRPTGAAKDVARDLQQWRAAYRDRAAQRPLSAPLLSTTYGPALDLASENRLLNLAALCLWLGGATAAAMVASLALARWWIVGEPAGQAERVLVGGLSIVVLVMVAGLVALSAAQQTVQDDLHRTVSDQLGWPRLPFVAGGAMFALLALVALLSFRSGRRIAHAGGTAAIACLLLALTLAGTCLLTRAATDRYETRLAELLDHSELEAVAGPEADRWLDRLRAWSP